MSEPIALLGGALRLRQLPEGFRSTSDAVLLASLCPAHGGQSVLDLGCGVGTVGLCLKHRVPDIDLSGIDIQADHIELARRNARENGMEATFNVADVLEKRGVLYHHVVCNPPYIEPRDGSASPHPAKATAKNNASLEDWITSAHRYLKAKGSLSLVHRSDHLDQILAVMHKRFGAVLIVPLWPKSGAESKRILIRAIKDSRTPARLLPGLTLHDTKGDYTPEAESILRGAQALL